MPPCLWPLSSLTPARCPVAFMGPGVNVCWVVVWEGIRRWRPAYGHGEELSRTPIPPGTPTPAGPQHSLDLKKLGDTACLPLSVMSCFPFLPTLGSQGTSQMPTLCPGTCNKTAHFEEIRGDTQRHRFSERAKLQGPERMSVPRATGHGRHRLSAAPGARSGCPSQNFRFLLKRTLNFFPCEGRQGLCFVSVSCPTPIGMKRDRTPPEGIARREEPRASP